jgi:uncharacterized protein (TIGR02145 family)
MCSIKCIKENISLLLMILFSMVVFSSCSGDESDGGQGNPVSPELGEKLLVGNWVTETLMNEEVYIFVSFRGNGTFEMQWKMENDDDIIVACGTYQYETDYGHITLSCEEGTAYWVTNIIHGLTAEGFTLANDNGTRCKYVPTELTSLPGFSDDEENKEDENPDIDVNLNPEGTVAEAVDMGLSVNWANHNVGASGIYDRGGSYGWGDAQGTCYSTDVKWYPSENPPMNITASRYDIARQKWGEDWRLPTRVEFIELLDNCETEWNETLGVLKLTSRRNGAVLYLPTTNIRSGKEYSNYSDEEGHYWTSEMSTRSTDYAYQFAYWLDVTPSMSESERYKGLSVRPVRTNPDYNPNDVPQTGKDKIMGTWTITGFKPSWQIVAVFNMDGTYEIMEYFDEEGDGEYFGYEATYNGEYEVRQNTLVIKKSKQNEQSAIVGTYVIESLDMNEFALQGDNGVILMGERYNW